MKNYILIFLLLFIAQLKIIAQINYSEFEKKMGMKTKSQEYNWVYKNVFIDYKIGGLNEIFIAPKKSFLYGVLPYSGATVPDDTITYIDAGRMFSIFNYTFEPRVNILNRHNYSLLIKSPLSFGFSVFSEPKKGNMLKKSGFFNINIPILFGVSSGLNSSFTNSSKRGFSLSAGYQIIVTPLIGGKADFLSFYKVIPIDEAYQQRKFWGMPLVQLDYYRLKKGSKVRGYSLAFCPYGSLYFKLAASFALTKK
jgi:hypothetical protein